MPRHDLWPDFNRQRLHVDSASALGPDQRDVLVADAIGGMREQPRSESSLFAFQFFDALANVVQSIAGMAVMSGI
jgi:hypothetical protein